MRKSMLLAAAAATALVLAGAGPSALAQGGPMMSPTAPPKAAKAPRKAGKARGYLPRSAKGPGRCGTHMYWKAGKCHDARTPGATK